MNGFIMNAMILGKKNVFRGNMRERLTYRIYVWREGQSELTLLIKV